MKEENNKQIEYKIKPLGIFYLLFCGIFCGIGICFVALDNNLYAILCYIVSLLLLHEFKHELVKL